MNFSSNVNAFIDSTMNELEKTDIILASTERTEIKMEIERLIEKRRLLEFEIEILEKSLLTQSKKLDSKILKDFITSHKPWEWPETGYNSPFTVLAMTQNIPKISYLFPFVAGGYRGIKGFCLLDGHIEFTKEQEELMEMFYIEYSWDTGRPSTGH